MRLEVHVDVSATAHVWMLVHSVLGAGSLQSLLSHDFVALCLRSRVLPALMAWGIRCSQYVSSLRGSKQTSDLSDERSLHFVALHVTFPFIIPAVRSVFRLSRGASTLGVHIFE